MSSALNDFLNRYKCKPGLKWGGERTHYSISNPKASYSIPPEQMALFRSLYRDAIFKHGKTYHLVEANQDVTPIKIDLDFHYNLDDKTVKKGQLRVYTKNHVEEFIQLYMSVMEEYLIPLRDSERICLVMEKESPVPDTKKGENAWKDGIHIVFPKVLCHHSFQELLRRQVLKTISTCFPRDIFTNQWSDILDKHIIRSSGWQMLGSCKPGKTAYQVTRMYKVHADHCEEGDVTRVEKSELIEMNSMIGYTELDCLPVQKEKEEELKKRMESSSSSNRYKNRIRPGVLRSYGGHFSTASKDTLGMVKKLVELLRPQRAETYGTWIEIGWCLHNIHNVDHQLLDVWIEFSKQSERHRREAEKACKDTWTTMKDEGLGVGTLRMWAREDNREGYKELIKDELFPRILGMCRNEGKIKEADVAELMSIMYRDQFVCVKEKPEMWYRFALEYHKWMPTEPVLLRSEISTKVYVEFKRVHEYYIHRSQDSEDDDHKKATNIFKAMNKLRSPTFKSSIVKESMEYFYDRTGYKFYQSLDERPHLLGMDNGTYDLNTDTFRDGRPDDRITFSTKCRYPDMMDDDTLDWVETKMAEITYFISQILPNPRVREFVMTVLSSFLSGNTNEEHFHIWTGSGGNGKSKLIELFELAIGDYSAKLPVSLLTGKRGQSSAASPEVAMLKGKRFVCLQEPSEGAKIDGGLMKEMTGGDKMYARALYANPIEFKPQFKIVLACNDPPELPKDDGGVWRRVKMVNFPSKFKPRDDLSAEDGTWDGSKWIPKNPDAPVYPMDETIDQKFEEWREVFLYMLLQQYKHYRENDLVIPPEVKATTNEYQQSQFKLSTFFKEVIQIDMDFVAQVSVTEIYDYYKDWFQDTQGGNKKEMLKRQDLTQYLESYYGDHRVEGSANMYTHIKFADERMGGSVDIGSRVSFRDEGLDDES